MAKKVKNATVVVQLRGTKYIYYTKLNQKARKLKALPKLQLKKYNPVTRKREIFKEK